MAETLPLRRFLLVPILLAASCTIGAERISPDASPAAGADAASPLADSGSLPDGSAQPVDASRPADASTQPDAARPDASIAPGPDASIRPDAAIPGTPTVLTVTDTVVTPSIKRLGVNLGDDVWYDASLYTKERVMHGGFEGILYRTIGFGPEGSAGGYTDWYGIGNWGGLIIGAPAWFLSGPRKWEPLTITAQAPYYYATQSRNIQGYSFTPTGAVPKANDGFMIEVNRDTTGFIGQHGGAYWVFAENATVRTEAGDVRPGSAGKIAAVLDAPGTGVARLLAPLANTAAMDVAGRWKYSIWAKGTGSLTLGLGDWNHQGSGAFGARTVTLASTWQEITGTIDVTALPSGWSEAVAFSLAHTGGTARLDELSVVHLGDTNPTPFRDELVALLKDLRPGSLRHLQIGGSSLENALRPRASRMAFAHSRAAAMANGTWPGHPNTNGDAEIHPYGLHEFLQLCEEVGTDPWYCTSGTLKQHELADLMEYLAGPTTTPLGGLRERLGHPAPWTDSFGNIHIEIGNEAWNGAGAYVNGGYNGQEYWRDLFASAKASPHYRSNVKLHAAGQAVNTWTNAQIASQHTNADGFAVAPYVVHELSSAQASMSDEQLYSYLYGYTWYHGHKGYMAKNYTDVTQAHGQELSIYEVNHHITGGDAPVAARNKLVTSIGGAINIANWTLMMMELQKVCVQNLFTLFQKSYNDIRLWGIALSMQKGHERVRPLYQAARMINRVMAGDMVQVTKSGANPTWNNAFDYDGGSPGDVPFIQAYSTRDGTRRGLVIFNLHRTDSLPVTVNLPRDAAGGQATRYELSAPSVNSNNEPEHAPEVVESETPLTGFASGSALTLPPHSLIVLRWQE